MDGRDGLTVGLDDLKGRLKASSLDDSMILYVSSWLFFFSAGL